MTDTGDALWRASTTALANRLDATSSESGLLTESERGEVHMLATRLRASVDSGVPPSADEVSMAAATVVRLAHRRLDRLAQAPASPADRSPATPRRTDVVIRRSPPTAGPPMQTPAAGSPPPSAPSGSAAPGAAHSDALDPLSFEMDWRHPSDRPAPVPLVPPPLAAPPPVAPPPIAPPPIAPPPIAPAPAAAPRPPLPPPPPAPLPPADPTGALTGTVAPPAVLASTDERPGVAPLYELLPSFRRAGFVTATVVVALAIVVLTAGYAAFAAAFFQGRSQRSLQGSASPVLTASDIGLDQVILSGDSRHDLARGPGFAPGSGTAGASQPIVIVGRRTTYGAPFGHVNSLQVGDELTLTATGHGYVFAVVGVDHQGASTPVALSPGAQELILVTGSPWYLGTSRLVVVARLVGAAPAVISMATTLSLPPLGGSPAHLALALVVLVVASGGLGFVWTERRRFAVPALAAATAVVVAFALFDVHLLVGALPKVL